MRWIGDLHADRPFIALVIGHIDELKQAFPIIDQPKEIPGILQHLQGKLEYTGKWHGFGMIGIDGLACSMAIVEDMKVRHRCVFPK